jgi:hypothetical protein
MLELKKALIVAISALWLYLIGSEVYTVINPTISTLFSRIPTALQFGIQASLIIGIAGLTFKLLYPRAKHLLWRFIRKISGESRTYFIVTGGSIGIEFCRSLDNSAKEHGSLARSLRKNTGIIDFPPNSAFGFKSGISHSVPMQHIPLKAGGESYSAAVANRKNEENKVRGKSIAFRRLFLPISLQQTLIGFDAERGKTCLSAIDAYQRWLCDQPRPKIHLIMVVTGEDPIPEKQVIFGSQQTATEAQQTDEEPQAIKDGDETHD